MVEARFEAEGRLWQFLMPGIVHGFANSLFAVGNHARLLGGGETQIARERAAILRASQAAEGTVEVLRFVSGDGVERPAARQVGVLLRHITELLKVPCREHGVRVKVSHTSVDSPANVDGVTLSRSLLETVRELVEHLPAGFGGVLDIDIAAQRREGVTLMLSVAQDRDMLPFPLDLARVIATSRRALGDDVVVFERLSNRQLTLRVPAVRELGPQGEPAMATA